MTPLRRRMLDDMSIRHFAPNTQRMYLGYVSRFAKHFGRSPELLGPEHTREYLIQLVQTRQRAAGTLIVATAALRFLFTVTLRHEWTVEDIPAAKKPFRLPVVLSREEVAQFLRGVTNLKHRTILTTIYATGLRVSEAVHLRIDGVDSQRMMLRVLQAKGIGTWCSRRRCSKRCVLLARPASAGLAVPRQLPLCHRSFAKKAFPITTEWL
jgi:integrase/recombinase XerD